ncbi:Hypothetical predicted protein [Cloeon dipterum]|uniref:C2H2-type domain-containing protein n=1 Tax=Cloeon dipterum TaxID=197152 RepID=A0A8S1BWV2_9INSE|nr:Hypothetical predicted protein [Cloeon dipterum]
MFRDPNKWTNVLNIQVKNSEEEKELKMDPRFCVEAVLEDGDFKGTRRTIRSKELKCPDCDQRFAFSSALKRHESNCVRHERRKHWSETAETGNDKKEQTPSLAPQISSFRCHLCEHSSAKRQLALKHLRVCHFPEYNLLVSNGELNPGAEEKESLIRAQEKKYPGYVNRKIICLICMHRFCSEISVLSVPSCHFCPSHWQSRAPTSIGTLSHIPSETEDNSVMTDVDMIYALTSVDVLYRKLSWVATWRNVAEDNVFLFTFALGNGKIRPDWTNISIVECGLKLINRSYANLGNVLWPNDMMHLVFFLQIGVYFFNVQNDLFLGPREALRLDDKIYLFKQVGAQKERAAIAYDSETDDDDDAENVTPLLNGKKSCANFHKNNLETASPNSKPTSNSGKPSLPVLSSGHDSKEDHEGLLTADIGQSKNIKNLETRSKTADVGKSESIENLETRSKTADIGESKSVENFETGSLPYGLLKASHDAEFAPVICAKSLSSVLGQYVPDSSNLLATKLPTGPDVDSPTQEKSLKQKAQTSARQDEPATQEESLKLKSLAQPDTHGESLQPELSPSVLKDGAADSAEAANRSDSKCLPTDIQCPLEPKQSAAHQDDVPRAKTIPRNPPYERLIIKSSRDALDVSSDIVYALGCKSVIEKALREVKNWKNVPLDDTFLYSYAGAYFELSDGVVTTVNDFSNVTLDFEVQDWPFSKLVGKLRRLRVRSLSAWAILYVIGYKLYFRGENWPLDLMDFNFFRWLALRYRTYLLSTSECRKLDRYENTDLLPSHIRMFRLVPKDASLQNE